MPKLPHLSLAFIQRMNPRERVLSLIVAGAVFVIANLLAINFLIDAFHDLGERYAADAQLLRRESYWAQSQPMWEQRTRWLQEKQPVLTNRDRAPTQLLEQVQGAARASQVLIKNQQLRALSGARPGNPAAGAAEYQAVCVHIETESDWKQLVNFLRLLQSPESFIAVDLASLHTDTVDAHRMHCSFEVSKWDAPPGK